MDGSDNDKPDQNHRYIAYTIAHSQKSIDPNRKKVKVQYLYVVRCSGLPRETFPQSRSRAEAHDVIPKSHSP